MRSALGSISRWLLVLLSVLVVLVALIGASSYWWVHQPMSMRKPVLDLSIELGTSPRGVAQAVVDAGVEVNPNLLYWWFKISGLARSIKAGSYELNSETSPQTLILKLSRGEETWRAVVLVEGWSFKQVRQALAREENLRHDTKDLAADEIMRRLDRPGVSPEGRFFPDTYTYAKGSSELAVLKRALTAMDKKLDAVWAQRAPETAITTAEQALVLASIVEKETGRSGERAMISSVFHNRLRIGMLLQTDPTVIYGMGDQYEGRLRKRDLQTDTPWNTYTRPGLPPTPIAMPGKAALLAAVQPASSRALYFVAKGDGSSQFSDNLDAHNQAVNRFIRGRGN
jgi:UPF0755 protein